MTQPDKFFRDRLYGFEKPVSPSAWKRIAETHGRTRANLIWLKAAAAIFLLAVAGVFLLPENAEEASENIARTTVKDDDRTPDIANHATAPKEDGPAEARETRAPSSDHDAKNIQERPTSGKKVPAPGVNKARGNEIEEPAVPGPALAETETDPLPGTASEDVSGAIAERGYPGANHQDRRSITIVFNADEVNEKYLTKKTTAEATSVDKETSGLKKLLDKAYDLKYNQDPLGELRQKKNEILALNFRSEKTTP